MTPTTVFAGSPDLASSALGGQALLASDEFFAGKENLLNPAEPVFLEDKYTDLGKWMDGWEPRRRRAPGHDWCIVKLGVPGELVGVDIDTRHFLGNHAPWARIDACLTDADASGEWLRDQADWTCILDQRALDRGGHNVFAVTPVLASHVRLSIYPAGGVARLRVHGRPRPAELMPLERVDLASVLRGGRALATSDMFFSRMDNLLLPEPPATMGQGWETKRSPLPKQDWVIVQLGQVGVLDELVLDTMHFKGNFPESAKVEAIYWPGADPHALTLSRDWIEIVPPTRLKAHQAHSLPVRVEGPWTHLKLTILTDGGVSRMRAFGRAGQARIEPRIAWLNQASEPEFTEALGRCCGSDRWVQGMLEARPFAGPAQLHGESARIWWHLGDGDWLEAFSHHPRIGADLDALRERYGSTASWAEGEQAGAALADEATLKALAEANLAYEERFGHIFIVCASGLSADEMLARLQERLKHNEPAFELRVAAGEQLEITRLRLDKLEVPA